MRGEDTIRHRTPRHSRKTDVSGKSSSTKYKKDGKSSGKDKKDSQNNHTDAYSSSSDDTPDYDGFAWLGLFLPALLYYLFLRKSHKYAGRRGIFSHGSTYPTLSNHIHCIFSKCDGMAELFGINRQDKDSGFTLMHPAQEVLSNEDEIFRHLNHPLWVHDEELGRGYLLFSDMSTNRIWRWEVGGGPITIGRTLHMERSGCRSNPENCAVPNLLEHKQDLLEDDEWRLGSAGLVMTTNFHNKNNNNNNQEHLLVSELGEHRITRVETDGARTPLVKPVDALDMLYVPTFDDLIFTVDRSNLLLALRQLQKIPAIPSSESRQAHFYNQTDHHDEAHGGSLLEVIYMGQSPASLLSGIALAHDFKSVYVLEETEDHRYLVMNVNLEEEVDDEEPETDDETETETKSEQDEHDGLSKKEKEGDQEHQQQEEEEEEEVITEEVIIELHEEHHEGEVMDLDEEDEHDEAVQDKQEEEEKKEDEEKKENEKLNEEEEDKNICKTNVFFDLNTVLSEYNINIGGESQNIVPGGIQTDIHGNVYVILNPVGIIVIDAEQDHVGTIPVFSAEDFKKGDVITNLAFGEDDHIYITTTTRLLRIKLKQGVKGMTMNVIKKSGISDKKRDWSVRCSSRLP